MKTLFEAVGEERLHRLIDTFYGYVSQDEILLKIFPRNWDEIAYKQKLFQTQFLGGPNLYIQEFGHPMMRARHMPFRITEIEKEAWLKNMKRAMQDVDLEEELQEKMMERYEMVGQMMVNTPVDDDD